MRNICYSSPPSSEEEKQSLSRGEDTLPKAKHIVGVININDEGFDSDSDGSEVGESSRDGEENPEKELAVGVLMTIDQFIEEQRDVVMR